MTEGPTNHSLGERARLAVLWNTGVITLINVGQFGVMLVLVRLLSPDVYGQYGMLMAAMGLLYVFSGQNFVDYTLQIRADSDVNFQDVFTTSIGVSFLLLLLTNVIAIALESLPDYADLSAPLHWLSIGFLLQPARSIRIAILKRALDWKRIRALHGIGFILSAMIAIPLAFSGAGIYTLLVPTFIVPIPFHYDLIVNSTWRPTWSWSFRRVMPALKFGMNRQASGLMFSGRRLVEGAVLVQILGFSGFGVYGRAIALSELLCSRFLNHAIETLYPSFTKIPIATERFRRVSTVILCMSAWFAIPMAVLVGNFAALIVKVIYGDKWLDVIPLIGWSAALAAAGAIYITLYKLLLAHQQERQCLWADTMLIAGTVVSLAWFLPIGITVYLQGLVMTEIACIAMTAVWLCSKRGVESVSFIPIFVAPMLGSACASTIFIADPVVQSVDSYALAHACMQVVLFVIIYVTILRLFFRRPLQTLVSYLPKRATLDRVLLLT